LEKKELKLNIKNTQIAKAIKLDSLKQKLAEKNSDAKKKKKKQAEKKVTTKAKKIEEESLRLFISKSDELFRFYFELNM